MNSQVYKEWIKMFNDDFSKIWNNERKEVQKISILLYALQNELRDIQNNVEVEISNLKQRLKNKDDLEKKAKSVSLLMAKRKSPNTLNKENDRYKEVELKHNNDLVVRKNHAGKESPDLFRNIDLNAHNSSTDLSIIDLSISEDDAIKGDGSPTIKKRRKRCRAIPNPLNFSNITRNVENPSTPLNTVRESVKTNLFKTPGLKSDHDTSVIDCTPEVVFKRSKISSRIGDFMSRKKIKDRKSNNSTLTQMFRRVSERQRQDIPENDADSDETFFDEKIDETKLGITDLINYINKDNTRNQTNSTVTNNREQELETSSQELDEFSKGAIFNEEDLQTSTEKLKPTTPVVEPIVRGKARKQLHGWSCQQCKNFYGQMNLSPEEMQKKMNECSRHRFKYKPPEETIPGFWDLSIPPENLE